MGRIVSVRMCVSEVCFVKHVKLVSVCVYVTDPTADICYL
jgi:hypothetical protein